jgi:hypothetical protein
VKEPKQMGKDGHCWAIFFFRWLEIYVICSLFCLFIYKKLKTQWEDRSKDWKKLRHHRVLRKILFSFSSNVSYPKLLLFFFFSFFRRKLNSRNVYIWQHFDPKQKYKMCTYGTILTLKIPECFCL